MKNILIACEESQRTTIEFRKRGFRCFSADLQSCSGGHPEWHIKGDVLEVLEGNCWFQTEAGSLELVEGPWDLIIAHPPCTYLTSAGATRMFNKDHTIKDPARFKKMEEASHFFWKFVNYGLNGGRIVIENPTPMHIAGLPKFTQMIHPFQFGDPVMKRTCLWCYNVPKLVPDNIVDPTGYVVRAASVSRRGIKNVSDNGATASNVVGRSKTPEGFARAYAEQYGSFLMKEGESHV